LKNLTKKLPLSLVKIVLFNCFLFLSLSSASEEVDSSSIEEEKKVERMRFFGVLDFASVKNPDSGKNESGIALGANLLYAYNSKWGFGGELAGNSIYKNFDVNAVYALSGNLVREQKKVSINNKKVLNIKNFGSSGFRVQAIGSQYYFNSSTGKTLSYSGLGVGGYYEFITKKKWSLITGAKYKTLAGGSKSSFTFFSGYVGMGFWF